MAEQPDKRRGKPSHSKSDQQKQGSQGQHGSMGKRGVVRPMHEMQGQSMEMSHEDRLEMLKMHHQQTLWIYWTLILLGVWVVLSPVTFGYDKALVEPSGVAGRFGCRWRGASRR